MASIADQIADDLMRRGIDLNRLEAGMARKVIGILNGLNVDVRKKLLSINPTAVTRIGARSARAKAYVLAVNKSADIAYREIESVIGRDMRKLANLEAKASAAMVNSSIRVDLMDGTLTPEMLTSLTHDTQLFQGQNLHQWLLTEKQTIRRVMKSVVNEGILVGTPVEEMARRLSGTARNNFKDGLMNISRTRARTIVRTSVNAVANKTRDQVYSKNSEVLKGKQWASTLDTRTSDQCIALDGSSWDLNGKPINGTKIPWRGPPPVHPNCRSILIPVVKSWSELNKNPAIAKKLKKAEAKIKPSTRANIDGKPVLATETYPTWLKKQSKTTQLEVLGPTKYKLWKAKKLSLTDMIDQSHRPLTVDELIRKYE